MGCLGQMARGFQQKAVLAFAVVVLAAVVAESQTTTFQIYAKCDTFVCPSGYKWRWLYREKDCFNAVCSFYDRDNCCRKGGWAWWAWFLLALGICYCCLACCAPLLGIPLLGGKKKKKKKARNQSDSDSYSSDEYYVVQGVY